MIGIIDYQMGNLRSVQKAFEHVGAETKIVACADEMEGLERLVLPGVGAFGDGMKHLAEQDLIAPIKAFAASGKPVMGICLGMQLLFDSSEEGEAVAGLGLVPGEVIRFQADQGPNHPRLKVPQMGWNRLSRAKEGCLPADVHGQHVYFVHGYHCVPEALSAIAALTTYGHAFCSVIEQDNLFATQFHPEKSQRVGLAILESFLNWQP